MLRQISAFERAIRRERDRDARDRHERENPSPIERMQRLAGNHTADELAQVLRNRDR